MVAPSCIGLFLKAKIGCQMFLNTFHTQFSDTPKHEQVHEICVLTHIIATVHEIGLKFGFYAQFMHCALMGTKFNLPNFSIHFIH